MAVTKGTSCRNMRRSQISIHVSKAIFLGEIIIKEIIRVCLIENVNYIFIPEYVLLWNTEGTLVTRISSRRGIVSPAKEKKASMKQHFSFLLFPALSKYCVKVICLGLGRFACKQCTSFPAELNCKFAPCNQTKSLAGQRLPWTD